MKIAFLDQSAEGWAAGATYTRMMLKSLSLVGDDFLNGDELVFISSGKSDGGSLQTLQSNTGMDAEDWGRLLRENAVDVVVPLRDHTIYRIQGAVVGWIPDLQHFRLPDLFTERDIQLRDAMISAVAQRSSLVILSSESAKQDFKTFAPEFYGKARVLSFSSMLWNEPLEDSDSVVLKYNLPDKYALVPNQFWKHKNHAILPPALALLRDAGGRLPLVLTGLPCDYRDFENRHLSRFFQLCSEHGVRGQVIFLGQVPYRDLISIMRRAELVIQPSFFEGWSTSIEDCKALGKPLACSDIPVHREQAPAGTLFFDPGCPASLAKCLRKFLDNRIASVEESVSLRVARDRAAEFGRGLIQIARDSFSLFGPEMMANCNSASFSSDELAEKRLKYIHNLEVACEERRVALEAVNAELERVRAEFELFKRQPRFSWFRKSN